LSYLRTELIEQRAYQLNIADAASKRSTLVVLPTGLGKTVIALMVIDRVLSERGGRVLFMAPTKPLAEQHFNTITSRISLNNIFLITGETPPERRRELWRKGTIVVATPQVVENDLPFIDISSISLMVFDECHRATGDYSYVRIAMEYHERHDEPLVLGMTASPGSDMGRVEEVCRTLGIVHIEVRTEEDPDVQPYVQGTRVRWIELSLTASQMRLISLIREMFNERIGRLKEMHLLPEDFSGSVKELLQTARNIGNELGTPAFRGQMFSALRVHAEAMKLGHALILAETQPLYSLRCYLNRLRTEGEKSRRSASATLIADPKFGMLVSMLSMMKDEHPKLGKLREVVSGELLNNPGGRIIIFTQYRDSVESILSTISNVRGARVGKLIGQGSRGRQKGLKQKEQIEVLSRFRTGEINVLVSTSVGEEGLDIASTDAVIFFEPVPSEIRTIQRKGRTGRNRPGKVIVLMTSGTVDEAYYHSSRRKERMMKENLLHLDARLSGAQLKRKQSSIFDF